MKPLTKAQLILAKHAKNYNKTVEKDEKPLYNLSLNGHEAINAMIEFAKLHVEAALKEACLQGSTCESRRMWEVTEEEIMSCYPLENIK